MIRISLGVIPLLLIALGLGWAVPVAAHAAKLDVVDFAAPLSATPLSATPQPAAPPPAAPQLATALSAAVRSALPESNEREQRKQQAGAHEAEASALLERWAPSFAREVSADHPERDRP
ncbi:MAG TPA: hypothetical protein VG963_15930, partial [Polyangiaceae bacterium]|nr:hypothetical protein [Polyangiaceae bacterium]